MNEHSLTPPPCCPEGRGPLCVRRRTYTTAFGGRLLSLRPTVRRGGGGRGQKLDQFEWCVLRPFQTGTFLETCDRCDDQHGSVERKSFSTLFLFSAFGVCVVGGSLCGLVYTCVFCCVALRCLCVGVHICSRWWVLCWEHINPMSNVPTPRATSASPPPGCRGWGSPCMLSLQSSAPPSVSRTHSVCALADTTSVTCAGHIWLTQPSLSVTIISPSLCLCHF